MKPPPRRQTVADYAAPYTNYLVNVPDVVVGVCDVCRGVASGYSRCYKCHVATKQLGNGVADVVAPISLAPTGEQFAHELYTYKRVETVPAELRLPRLVGLAAVLWSWLTTHEKCLASVARTERFDLITTVPSTSGRLGEHPLVQLVSGVVVGSSDRYRPLLTTHRTELGPREFAVDRYRATRDLDHASVLIIDDTWTTGAHAQSASAALKSAGAARIAIVVLGRWITTTYQDHGAWLNQHRSQGWNWERCCFEH